MRQHRADRPRGPHGTVMQREQDPDVVHWQNGSKNLKRGGDGSEDV